MAKTYFEDVVGEIQAEAEAEGPEAVAELRSLEHRFRLAGQLVALRGARVSANSRRRL